MSVRFILTFILFININTPLFSMENQGIDDRPLISLVAAEQLPEFIEEENKNDIIKDISENIVSSDTRQCVNRSIMCLSLVISSISSIRMFYKSKDIPTDILMVIMRSHINHNNQSLEMGLQYTFGILSFIPNFARANLSFLDLGEYFTTRYSLPKSLDALADYTPLQRLHFVLNIFSPLCTFYLCYAAINGLPLWFKSFITVSACLTTFLTNSRGMDLLTSRCVSKYDSARDAHSTTKRKELTKNVKGYFTNLSTDMTNRENFLSISTNSDSQQLQQKIPLILSYDGRQIEDDKQPLFNSATYIGGGFFAGMATYSTYILSEFGSEIILKYFDAPRSCIYPLSMIFAIMSAYPWAALSVESNQRVIQQIYNKILESKENQEVDQKQTDIRYSASIITLGLASAIPALYGAILSTSDLPPYIGWPINLSSFISIASVNTMSLYDQIPLSSVISFFKAPFSFGLSFFIKDTPEKKTKTS